MNISFKKIVFPASGTLAVGFYENITPTVFASLADSKTGGALIQALKASSFKGNEGDFFSFYASAGKKEAIRFLCIGLGPEKTANLLTVERFAGTAVLKAGKSESEELFISACFPSSAQASTSAARAALAAQLSLYEFSKYKTKKVPHRLKNVTVLTESPLQAEKEFETFSPLLNGIFWARDMVSEPANALTPKKFVKGLSKLEDVGVRLTVLNEKDMEKIGMNMLLGVAQGSKNPPYLAVLELNGGRKGKKGPLAFVGKGVCFDSGGISLKPPQGMEEMKDDMSGAAAVAGAMYALAASKFPEHVIGVLPLVENMPSGAAQRPGDVVTTLSGQTVEVINTDAEGRLILGDALTYVQNVFEPADVIDLATLTGAMLIALGTEYAGLFSNSDPLAKTIEDAASKTGERVWRMPMGPEFGSALNSDIADMKNVSDNRQAGSIIGAEFIKRFVQSGTRWAHLDIAGTAWTKKNRPNTPKGASGFGVRLLTQLASDYYALNKR